MRLYLLRHTKVDVTEGMCYGQTDVGLAKSFSNELGPIFEQLSGVEFDYFYTSPLTRCVLLAEQIEQKLTSIPFIKDARLKELNFGDWETQLWPDIENTDVAKIWFADWVSQPTPNGESYRQLAERVNDFLIELKRSDTSGNVLIVSHGGVLRAINALVRNLNLENAFDLNVGYGEILKLELK